MSVFIRIFILLICFSVSLFGVSAAQEQTQPKKLLIIYDSSNSMWGQLADKSRKLEAGRTAIRKLLETGIGNRDVGFRAYGHRQSGDCRDSELMVPFSDKGQTNQDIRKAVDTIAPKGKTPITYSLQEGLKDLDGSDGDILLITDGIETCDADPCALMSEWNTSKINIRVHVVGVGLKESEKSAISCIADISGGQYFDANSAERFTEALTEAKKVVVEAPKPEKTIVAETPKPKKQLKSTAAEPEAPKKPEITKFNIKLLGRDKFGRDYKVAGTLKSDGGEAQEIRSDRRITVEQSGNYVFEVGAVLQDGTVYTTSTHPFSIDPKQSTTEVVVLIEKPAIVTATFMEDGKPQRGKAVTVIHSGKELFSFNPGAISKRREILLRPGDYEFRSQPNPDNKLSIAGTLAAGEETELVFEMLTTVRAYVTFKLDNGDTIRRVAELWKDDAIAYKANGRNGALVRPGTYEIRADDFLLPAPPTQVEINQKEQEITVNIDAGFIQISYADTPDNYLGGKKGNRAWIYPSHKTSYAFARPDTPIPVSPGNYRVEGYDNVGYFEPGLPFDVKSGETVKVVLTPKPLGVLIVNYAPSEDYPSKPDRAFASAVDGQPLKNGFMRPGKPLRVLPGRYVIEGRKGFDMKAKEVTLKAGETTEVVLELVTQE